MYLRHLLYFLLLYKSIHPSMSHVVLCPQHHVPLPPLGHFIPTYCTSFHCGLSVCKACHSVSFNCLFMSLPANAVECDFKHPFPVFPGSLLLQLECYSTCHPAWQTNLTCELYVHTCSVTLDLVTLSIHFIVRVCCIVEEKVVSCLVSTALGLSQ